MTIEIALVLSILAAAMVLLVTEWIPMEATALFVLGTVALTGLVTPVQALSGFSNPAVVTVWAVFILSAGLQRTGVANILGRHVQRLAGHTETRMAAVIMLSVGLMSAVMNNVAVAALMLPVTMDMARRTKTPPSRLLMPLAFGSLLGGLTTMIGTPPNILVSNALRDAGLQPFKLFDFAPVGVFIMLVGTAFMATIGRKLLPARDVAKESSAAGHLDLQQQYDLRARMFRMRVRADSALAGKTLAESRLGTMLGLNVIAIVRAGRTELAPSPGEVLRGGDRLLAEGRLERLNDVSGWRELEPEDAPAELALSADADIKVVEASLAKGSFLDGKTLRELEFRSRFGLNVLAIRRDDVVRRARLQDETLSAGDVVLLHGPSARLETFKTSGHGAELREVTEAEVHERYRLSDRLRVLRVPQLSILIGRTLAESQLGGSLGAQVLAIIRDDGTHLMPEPQERLMARDRLLVTCRPGDLEITRALEGLELEREVSLEQASLESERVGLMEAILSPHTALAGKTLRQLHFREKYGLNVLAIWREGRPYRSGIGDIALRFGDALLLYGPREKLRMLGREPDFLVLTEAAQEVPPVEKAKMAALIMGAVILPVILGIVPIYIATVVGAALMVSTRCLTMEEAYRAIEWKAIFLIAGMLPLGVALDTTGAASLLAASVVAVGQPFGPTAVMVALVVVTFMATFIVPTAALVVLMSPIILNTAADMGMSPYALMMAMAMAASSSFTSPVAHPANLMVMGPGGYRFADYARAGVPLTIVVFIVILVVVPLFWPLLPG